MVFKLLKSLQTGIENRLSGRTDVLEAICAGAALVASADGDISDKEINTVRSSIKANKVLAAAFDEKTTTRILNDMLDKAETGGRSGRANLYKQIQQVAGDSDTADTVMLAVLDVADHGGIDDKEMAVVEQIAQHLRVDAKTYLAMA